MVAEKNVASVQVDVELLINQITSVPYWPPDSITGALYCNVD
jgi:hypothetical protein